MNRDSGKKKHQKALERAKKVKVRMAARRKAHDAAMKEEQRLSDLERKIAKDERLLAAGKLPQGRGYSDKLKGLLDEVNRQIPNQRLPKTDEERVEEIRNKLERNVQMLRDMESEHDEEVKRAEEFRKAQEAQALQAQEADRDDPGEPPAETVTQPLNFKRKFAHKFQEAASANRNPPPYRKSLADQLAGLKKFKFSGSAKCSFKPNDCQPEQQAGENTEEKVTEGA